MSNEDSKRAYMKHRMQKLVDHRFPPKKEDKTESLATIEKPKKKRAKSMLLKRMMAKVHKRKIARQESQFHPEVINLAQEVQNSMSLAQLETTRNDIEVVLDRNGEAHWQLPSTSSHTSLSTAEQVAQHLAPYIDQHIRELIYNPPTASHLQKN